MTLTQQLTGRRGGASVPEEVQGGGVQLAGQEVGREVVKLDVCPQVRGALP